LEKNLSTFVIIEVMKKFVSVDIEASGPTPGKYSMLSLGACIVGDTSKQFYRELKPLNKNFVIDAMRIGCRGLRCLDDLKHIDSYNPFHPKFNPSSVLDVLVERGEEPKKVMKEFADWIDEKTIGHEPVLAAYPIKFDGMFISWYFDNFHNRDPFGFSGEDMNSMLKGLKKDLDAHLSELNIRPIEMPHNALEDAIVQAKEFEKILELMKK
jgi:DNA polymerase III epsilon subunit-like protein